MLKHLNSYSSSIISKIRNINFWLIISVDILIFLFSLYLAFLIRFDFKITAIYYSLMIKNLSLCIIVKLIIFLITKIYKGMYRYTSITDIFIIGKASIFSSVILITISWFSEIMGPGFPISVLIIDFILTSFLISISRIIIRIICHYLKNDLSISSFLLTIKNNHYYKNNSKKRIVIIGAGNAGERIIREVMDSPFLKIKVVGLFDDNNKSIKGLTIHGVKILGSTDELTKFRDSYDEIIICTPRATAVEMRLLVKKCRLTNKKFTTLPAIWELIDGSVSYSKIRDVSIIDLLGRDEVVLDGDSVIKFLRGKRVLITGAGGSIGSELAKKCLEYDISLLVMFDNCEYNIFNIEKDCEDIIIEKKYVTVLADIRNFDSIKNIFNKYKPEIVIHAAAYKHVSIQEVHPWECVNNNVMGSMNVMRACEECNADVFIYVSSDKAVNPVNVMGATKRVVELLIQEKNGNCSTRFMAVRFGNVINSSGNVISIFKNQIRKGGPLTITHPEMSRYFMSTTEASQLILKAGSLGKGGEIFILDMGEPIKIDFIAKELIRLSGFKDNKEIKIEYTGLRPGEKICEELFFKNEKQLIKIHKKIMVAMDNEDNHRDSLIAKVNNLINISRECKADLIKSQLKEIVPEYNPQQCTREKEIESKLNSI